jgi:hypothetical protein
MAIKGSKKQFCTHGHDTFVCGRTKNSMCNDCRKAYRTKYGNEYHKKWEKENPDKIRGYRLKHTFNISLEDYNKLFQDQKGLCRICKKHQSQLNEILVIDHNHDTDEIRGLLCRSCNMALGLLKDNKIFLQNALDYLS